MRTRNRVYAPDVSDFWIDSKNAFYSISSNCDEASGPSPVRTAANYIVEPIKVEDYSCHERAFKGGYYYLIFHYKSAIGYFHMLTSRYHVLVLVLAQDHSLSLQGEGVPNTTQRPWCICCTTPKDANRF